MGLKLPFHFSLSRGLYHNHITRNLVRFGFLNMQKLITIIKYYDNDNTGVYRRERWGTTCGAGVGGRRSRIRRLHARRPVWETLV